MTWNQIQRLMVLGHRSCWLCDCAVCLYQGKSRWAVSVHGEMPMENSCWAYQWRARQEPRQISHVTMTFSWSEAWYTDLCWQTLFLHCFVSHLAAKVRDMYNTTGCVIETPHIKQHRLLMMKWCLMSSDVGWHIRDQLRPMPKHGSIYLYVHGKPEGSLGRTAQDGQLDSHTAPELWAQVV